jgi:membrane protease YdiL (CAAX protease family)
LIAAHGVATLAVAADLALVHWAHYHELSEGRGTLAVVALAINFWLVGGDVVSVGLTQPAQGWRRWGWLTLLIGSAVAICIAMGIGILWLLGRDVPVHATAPRDIGVALLRMCVIAPVLEETIYRLAICLPLTISLGPWPAILVSGTVFAILHVVYGNPSPENLVGGFFLAWAFLKSASIAVPVVLHSLGNLCALAAQVAAWYWLRGGL